MTRSITIVNTSNWDGEDYLIEIPGIDGQRQDAAWRERLFHS